MTSTLPSQASSTSASALASALSSTTIDPHESAAGPSAKDHPPASNDDDDEDSSEQPQVDQSGKPITVFQDPNNFNVKHPLYNKWTLWFDNPSQKGASKGSKESWGDDLNKVISFDSVEEFWGLYNNVISPSDLPARANYYLFKEGIKPAWEDPANGKGGKWSIQLPREKTKSRIDQIWLYTMLSAIGETLEQPFGSSSISGAEGDELITGVILAARPNFFRVAVWTTKANDTLEEGGSELEQRLLDIGKQFKVGVLGFELEQRVASGLGTEVEFQSHVESEKKRGKKTNL